MKLQENYEVCDVTSYAQASCAGIVLKYHVECRIDITGLYQVQKLCKQLASTVSSTGGLPPSSLPINLFTH